MVGHHLKGVASIKIIGIDDGERLVYHILGHQNGVVGAPGFLSSFRHFETFRQVVKFLEHIFHINTVAKVFGIYLGFEFLFETMTYHKHHFAKSGAYGVVNGVVHNDFAVRPNAVHLFQSTVAAAHSGSKY